ncbi:CapA family protein [Streptomyces sp. NPDC052693]|uniref:CapA family protein n=1 Tax=Streptomyces sp. NPDC052693 TaxID=3155814 RepID=UPI0034170D83
MRAAGDVFTDVENGEAAFAPVVPVLAPGDIVLGNCEGVYSDRPAKSPSHKHYMGTTVDRAAPLASAGFTVMTSSNNHALDGGYVGLDDTRRTLEGLGINVLGAGADLEEAVRPYVTEHNGVRVAILGFSTVFPKGYEARPNRPGLAPLRVTTSYLDPDENFWEPGIPPLITTAAVPEDQQRMRDTIAAAREQADVVVVSMHWGYSHVLEQLMDYEPRLARDAIDHGADAVLCTHHHALRPVEWHGGRPIFYGTGALVHHFVGPSVTPQMRANSMNRYGELSSMRPPAEEFELWPFAEEARRSMVVALTLRKGERPVAEAGFFPVQMLADGSTTALRPEDSRAAVTAGYVERMSADQGFAAGFERTSRDGWAYVRVTDPAAR